MTTTSLRLALFAACLAASTGACATTSPCLETMAGSLAATGQHARYRTIAGDGTCLQGTHWRPRQESPRAVVVVVHGFRDHGRRYQPLAEALIEQGFAVLAQDHRGHGRSGGPRQRFDSMAALVDDVDRAVRQARIRHPGAPVFLYGHSMGGLVAVHYSLAHQQELAGLVLSGALLQLPDDVSPAAKLVVRGLGSLLPGLPLQEIDDTRFVTADKQKRLLASDPLIDHGRLPARTALVALTGVESAQARFAALTLPLFIHHGAEDVSTSVAGSHALYARASSADKSLRIHESSAHDLLHEPAAPMVIAEVTTWISKRVPAAVGP